MGYSIVYCLLFLLAFVVFPIGISIFETPKIISAEFLILILTIYTTIRNTLSLKKISKTFLIILLGIALLSLYHLFLKSTPTSFFGNIYRMQGVFLLWLLVSFALISSEIKINISQKIVFLVIFLSFIFELIIDGGINGRGIGTLGEPNALAAFLVFLWPFLVFNQSSKKIFYVGSLVSILGILLTGSRSGLLGFLLELIFILCLRIFKLPLKKVFLISLLFYCLFLLSPLVQSMNLYEDRLSIWKISFYSGLKNPLLGGGFGNAQFLIHQSSLNLDSLVKGSFVDSSHNLFLDWFLQGGLLGLILFIGLVSFSFTNFIKTNRDLETILLLGLITTLSFNPASIVSLIELWWVLGQGARHWDSNHG